jgi:hypothetical protein
MLITKDVEVKYNNNNYKHYLNLGYDFNYGDIMRVPIDHLIKGSGKLVEVKCDICGKIRKIPYKNYIKCHTFNLDVCSKKSCTQVKIKKANLLKYGNECYYFTEDFIKKSNKTKLQKYGDINYNNPEKNKQTNLKKYGKEFALQVNKFIEKSKQTKIERYGDEKYTNKEKMKRTIFEKYGVNNITKVPKINKKIVNSRIKNRLSLLSELGIRNINNDNEYVCNQGHTFKIDPDLLANRFRYKTIICPVCNPINSYSRSGKEILLSEFIKNEYKSTIEFNDKKIIGKELDIYLPNLKLAFEFNGLFWHNEITTDKNYHLNKTEDCEKLGIHLIHIYEDDWEFKQDILKSRILNLLGKSNKIYARKCEIREINDNKHVREFLEQNHLQGFVGSKIKIGLFYQENLVSLMAFGSQRKSMGQKSSEGTYEMLRFCNKLNTNVIGGASRLFKYFVNNYQPNEVISYADRSWSTGNLYEKLGFKLIHKTKPNYYYIINKIRRYRFNYRKDKLIREGSDPNKTEHEIMLERKIYRIYDSGNLKYIYNKNK